MGRREAYFLMEIFKPRTGPLHLFSLNELSQKRRNNEKIQRQKLSDVAHIVMVFIF